MAGIWVIVSLRYLSVVLCSVLYNLREEVLKHLALLLKSKMYSETEADERARGVVPTLQFRKYAPNLGLLYRRGALGRLEACLGFKDLSLT